MQFDLASNRDYNEIKTIHFKQVKNKLLISNLNIILKIETLKQTIQGLIIKFKLASNYFLNKIVKYFIIKHYSLKRPIEAYK